MIKFCNMINYLYFLFSLKEIISTHGEQARAFRVFSRIPMSSRIRPINIPIKHKYLNENKDLLVKLEDVDLIFLNIFIEIKFSIENLKNIFPNHSDENRLKTLSDALVVFMRLTNNQTIIFYLLTYIAMSTNDLNDLGEFKNTNPYDSAGILKITNIENYQIVERLSKKYRTHLNKTCDKIAEDMSKPKFENFLISCLFFYEKVMNCDLCFTKMMNIMKPEGYTRANSFEKILYEKWVKCGVRILNLYERKSCLK